MAEQMTDTEKRIEDAADLITGGHSGAAYNMLVGALGEVTFHHHGAGAKAHQNWIAALELLAAVCLAIATMEKRKMRS